jgi:hypothetical protein
MNRSREVIQHAGKAAHDATTRKLLTDPNDPSATLWRNISLSERGTNAIAQFIILLILDSQERAFVAIPHSLTTQSQILSTWVSPELKHGAFRPDRAGYAGNMRPATRVYLVRRELSSKFSSMTNNDKSGLEPMPFPSRICKNKVVI